MFTAVASLTRQKKSLNYNVKSKSLLTKYLLYFDVMTFKRGGMGACVCVCVYVLGGGEGKLGTGFITDTESLPLSLFYYILFSNMFF